MTQHARPEPSTTRGLWTLATRTVRPTWGARCNAAEALQEARSLRDRSAEAVAALADGDAGPAAEARPAGSTARGGRR